MAQVNKSSTTVTGPDRFATQASDLALPVGHWPKTLTTDIGNGRPFEGVARKFDDEGDLVYVRYVQPVTNFNLFVFND